ncbi:MAG TPA: ATP-binding protein [Streptosporangiaceae bacterium]
MPFLPAPDWRCSHQELGPPHSALPAAGRHCRITLAPAPESTGAARGFTTATLHGWHLDTLIQDAVIVASELVTNAIRHGSAFATKSGKHTQVELTWQRQASRLICVVTDRSPKPPVLAPADLNAESGRGLQIVHALVPAWGWTMLSAQEKAVWAALQLPLPATRRCADGNSFPARPGTRRNYKPQPPGAQPLSGVRA